MYVQQSGLRVPFSAFFWNTVLVTDGKFDVGLLFDGCGRRRRIHDTCGSRRRNDVHHASTALCRTSYNVDVDGG